MGGQRHAPADLPSETSLETVWTGVENLAPTGNGSPNPPARTQPLSRPASTSSVTGPNKVRKTNQFTKQYQLEHVCAVLPACANRSTTKVIKYLVLVMRMCVRFTVLLPPGGYPIANISQRLDLSVLVSVHCTDL